MLRRLYDEDHEHFRASVRQFLQREVVPHMAAWESAGRVDADLWPRAASLGLLGLAFPEEHGGGGTSDYRYRCVVKEELAKVAGASLDAHLSLVDDLAGPYLIDLADEEQQRRWLPDLVAGRTSPALAITEPGAGSDLRSIATTAKLDGDEWLLHGSKTFITNGADADVVVVVTRTGEARRFDAFTLLVVERGMEGFSSGRPLDKIGQRAENVAELFFDGVRVPDANRLGEVGRGLAYVKERLPHERLSIGFYGLAAAEAALAWTVEHVQQREAYAGRLSDLQHVRLELAEMSTEIDVSRSFLQDAVLALNDGRLSATDAAKAKWWGTDLQQRVVNRCLQLHGGYGYMREYPIARAFLDARVQTIYGGANEVMKDLIGRRLVAADDRR